MLHIDAWAAEFAFSAQHLRSWTFVAWHYAMRCVVWLQRWAVYAGDVERFGQHTTHAKGRVMREEDVHCIRSLVWQNTHIYEHERGDMVYLDNYRIGHGRQPYSGRRIILTTWA